MNTTSEGDPPVKRSPHSQLAGPRLANSLRAALIGVLAVSLATGSLARADDLDDEKKKLEQQISQSKQDLHDYNQDAAKAAAALTASEQALKKAQVALKAAEGAEEKARLKDEKAAKDLEAAKETLATAKKQAAAANAAVAKWMKTVGRVVIQGQQQRTDLLGLAVLTTDTRMGSLNQRVQWSRSMQESTQSKLDALRELQMKRDAAKAAADKAEKAVSAKRAAAAAAYKDAQQATADSTAARDAHAEAVSANEEAKKAADLQVKAEQARQSQLESESAAVAKRISARIAAEKAAKEEARQKAIAEAKAKAEAEAAERKAAEARRKAAAASAARRAQLDKAAAAASADAAAKKRSAAAASRNAAAARKSVETNTPVTSSGLIYPSSGPITSPYGMRFHPVLRYWKLHDGTDFGAACGAPIRAAAAGTVTERYYNAGYGNRLLVDHGQVNGRYLTTAYNHATHYIVSPGQRVSQGQVIGYVGSTGYSTGCHLHYMTYVNGSVVDPMSLY